MSKIVGVEIDMVVIDGIQALEFYEKIFEIERVEVTNFDRGENEAIFSLYGARFHLLDENQDFQLIAPTEDHPKTVWFNVMVPDIKETYMKALDLGCKEIQPITEMHEFGIENAIFLDPFGYVWMLHQVYKEVSFEERVKYFEENKEKKQ